MKYGSLDIQYDMDDICDDIWYIICGSFDVWYIMWAVMIYLMMYAIWYMICVSADIWHGICDDIWYGSDDVWYGWCMTYDMMCNMAVMMYDLDDV